MIRSWIQSVVGFLILMSLVSQLIPEEKYRKYVRLSMGLILILIMMHPVIEIFNLDLAIFQNFLQSQMKMNSEEIKSSGTIFDVSSKFTENYEEMIYEELTAYFKASAMNIKYLDVEIEMDVNRSDYGEIRRMEIGIIPVEYGEENRRTEKKIKVEKIDVDSQKETSGKMEIPEEKIKTWKQELSHWFGIDENQLKLEIIS